jgi:hypothetical protein
MAEAHEDLAARSSGTGSGANGATAGRGGGRDGGLCRVRSDVPLAGSDSVASGWCSRRCGSLLSALATLATANGQPTKEEPM